MGVGRACFPVGSWREWVPLGMVLLVAWSALPAQTLTVSGGSADWSFRHAPVSVARPEIAIPISQMADDTPQSAQGVACTNGGLLRDTSWWRRFRFAEHPSVGAAATVASVSVGSESGGPVPATVRIFTVPRSSPADTIRRCHLVQVGEGSGTVGGDLAMVQIPVTSAPVVIDTARYDLVVEYHVDSAEMRFFPAMSAAAETHPSFLSSVSCNIAEPATMESVGYGNSHLIMVAYVNQAARPDVVFDDSFEFGGDCAPM